MPFIDDDGCPCGFFPATRVSPDLKPFDAAMFRDVLLDGAKNLSDRAIERYAKKWIFDFFAVPRSDADVFDFMVEFRHKAHCGIDPFVSELCNVAEFYARPAGAGGAAGQD